MKKLCVVLLMLLIICNLGFAKLTGIAKAYQRFDFNNNTIDYNVFTTVSGSFIIDFLNSVSDSGEKKGNELPYSEFEVSATFGAISAEFFFKGTEPQRNAIGERIEGARVGNPIEITFGDDGYELVLPFWDETHNTDMWKTFSPYIAMRIQKFRTIGDGWSLDLINVPDPANYAKGTTFFGTSFIDYNRDADGNQIRVASWYDFTYQDFKSNPKGFTFQYDDVGKIGVAISNRNEEGEKTGLALYVVSETSDLYLSDSMTMKASVTVGKKEDYREYCFGGSFLLLYENELYFRIASDIGKGENSFGAEVSAEGAYENVSGELYYVSLGNAWYYDKYIDEDRRTYGYGGTLPAEQYLGARLVVDMTPYFPKLNPKLTVFGKNLIHWGNENIGFSLTAAYVPYVMGFEFGMQNCTNGNPSVYFRAWTDFADYTNVPFSSFILQVGDGVSLDAYDIVPGLDAGCFAKEVRAGEYGGGLRITYENSRFFSNLIAEYDYNINKYCAELNLKLFATQNLTFFGRYGFGATKDAYDYYEFNDMMHGRLGLSYANSRMKFEMAAQVVQTDQSVEFGAYLEAELYIIDGAVVSVSYNPRELGTERIIPLNEDNKGILEVAYTVRY